MKEKKRNKRKRGAEGRGVCLQSEVVRGATCICAGCLSGLGSRGFPVDKRGEVSIINVGAFNNDAPSLGTLQPLLHPYLSSLPLSPSQLLLDHNSWLGFLALIFGGSAQDCPLTRLQQG